MTNMEKKTKKSVKVVISSGQYETAASVKKVSYTTRYGLVRRLAQLAEQNAVYGDNWAGWINANIAIASEKDRWGDNSIIGGEWCEPANGWLDFNDYGSIHSDLDRLGL